MSYLEPRMVFGVIKNLPVSGYDRSEAPGKQVSKDLATVSFEEWKGILNHTSPHSLILQSFLFVIPLFWWFPFVTYAVTHHPFNSY